MQYAFIAYHYFGASYVYKPIRVFVSVYVWLTGYGNYIFFSKRRDFSFPRFAQVMWRLNFTGFMLCLLLNNSYILYYILPLHTFYFVLVYATMRFMPDWKDHARFAVLYAIIYTVWDVPSTCGFGSPCPLTHRVCVCVCVQ